MYEVKLKILQDDSYKTKLMERISIFKNGFDWNYVLCCAFTDGLERTLQSVNILAGPSLINEYTRLVNKFIKGDIDGKHIEYVAGELNMLGTLLSNNISSVLYEYYNQLQNIDVNIESKYTSIVRRLKPSLECEVSAELYKYIQDKIIGSKSRVDIELLIDNIYSYKKNVDKEMEEAKGNDSFKKDKASYMRLCNETISILGDMMSEIEQ